MCIPDKKSVPQQNQGLFRTVSEVKDYSLKKDKKTEISFKNQMML